MIIQAGKWGGAILPAQKKETDMNLTTNNIARATLSDNEAGAFLPLAAQAAIKGKAEIDTAKAKGAAALAVMIAGFSCDSVAMLSWNFDITASGDVHEHVETVGVYAFGNDDLAWKRNGEGAISKVAQSAYKNALCAQFLGLKESVPAVWTMASKAIPVALAIRDEGMVAKIVDGALVLEGGTSERAAAMRDAKSLTALTKVAKGEAGSNRDGGHGAGKGKSEGEAGEARAATPSEILAAAARLCEGVAKGDEAICNSALSFARKIAALVAANPEAFAE